MTWTGDAKETHERRIMPPTQAGLHKLEALRRLARIFRATIDVNRLLEELLEEMLALLDAERATLYLISEDGCELRSRLVQGGAVAEIRLKVGEGIAGWVAQTGETINLIDAYADPRFNPEIDRVSGFRTRSMLCMPLPGQGGRIVGVAQILNKRGHAFDGDDEAMLAVVGAYAGIAIENARIKDERSKQERLAAIGQLLAGILHDLKTPMTIVSGYAQLLAQADDVPTRSQLGSGILRQLDFMSAMMRDVLQFARGETQLLIRKVHVHWFLEEVRQQLGPLLETRSVRLIIDERFDGTACFDELKLLRVLHNLARNAAQAMPAGGTLQITVDRQGDELRFDVSDTGQGIPAELEGRLFQLFATSGKSHGTGLGLAIVKKIVEEHGGRIGYTSRVGQGTTFHIALPLARSPAP